jgi:hypothetical protein
MKKNRFNENQLTLPLDQIRTQVLSYEGRVRVFWALCFVSLGSLILYIYAINATAHNIALRQELEKEVAQISVNLSSIEFDSIEMKNAITIETAHQYGFAEVKEPLYVTRDSADSLTLNTSSR